MAWPINLLMAWPINLNSIASRLYFLIIILQIPLFWIPCRIGMCKTPMEMTCSQLIASDVIPTTAVKALLYPGAIANGLISSMTIPSWDNLLNLYNLTDVKNAFTDLHRLEVIAGSYFSVAGALFGLMKPGRMTIFGTLLVMWGLVKEGILGKPVNTDPTKAVYVYPMMLIALICAAASVKYDVKKADRYDVKKADRSSQAPPVKKKLQSSSKSKLN